MKTYKVIRDIAIIIIALVVLNNQYTILENQNLIAKSMVELAEVAIESNVEVSSTIDTIVVLDTIIVPVYNEVRVSEPVVDTVLVEVKELPIINTSIDTDTITAALLDIKLDLIKSSDCIITPPALSNVRYRDGNIEIYTDKAWRNPKTFRNSFRKGIRGFIIPRTLGDLCDVRTSSVLIPECESRHVLELQGLTHKIAYE